MNSDARIKLIKDAMKKARISQSELARRLDCTPARVSTILSGRHGLSIETIAKIAKALGLRVEISLKK